MVAAMLILQYLVIRGLKKKLHLNYQLKFTVYIRYFSFYASVMLLKNVAQIEIEQIEHKIPIKKTYFLRVRG